MFRVASIEDVRHVPCDYVVLFSEFFAGMARDLATFVCIGTEDDRHYACWAGAGSEGCHAFSRLLPPFGGRSQEHWDKRGRQKWITVSLHVV
jgi:hypothetical protein